jgi:hypothetical protein
VIAAIPLQGNVLQLLQALSRAYRRKWRIVAGERRMSSHETMGGRLVLWTLGQGPELRILPV